MPLRERADGSAWATPDVTPNARFCRRPRVSAPLVVMPRGVESLGSLLAGSVSAQESSFQVRATHTMAMVVATSMAEKYM